MYLKRQSIYLVQKAPVGYLQFKISEQEQRVLRVLLAPENDVFNCWKELWNIIDDYEALDFSCKELMPAAVRRVQLCLPQHLWQSVCGDNAGFLIGLPRYVWTKNQYVINQTKVILKQFLQDSIEVISIKGVSEILSNAEMAFMRTTRDIDLLIRQEDLNKCAAILKQTGWIKKTAGNNEELIEDLIEYHAYAYKKAGVIIELDLHVAAISGMYNNTNSFTKYIRDGAIISNSAEGLILPSPEGRLIMAITNVYNTNNWRNGHYCKYIFDAAVILNTLDQRKIDKCIDDGHRLLGVGDKIEQIIDIVGEIKASINPDNALHEQDVKSKTVFFTVNDRSLINIRILVLIIALFKTWISGRNMLGIPVFLISKFFKQIFVKPIIRIKKRVIKSPASDIAKTKKISRMRWSFSRPG